MLTLQLTSILTFALFATQGLTFEFNDCSGEEAAAKLLQVNTSCSTSAAYCPLVAGETVKIEVEFQTSKLE